MDLTGSQRANGSWRARLWVSVSQTQTHGPVLHLPAASADMIFILSGSKPREIPDRKAERFNSNQLKSVGSQRRRTAGQAGYLPLTQARM